MADPFRNYDSWLEEPYQRQQAMETECPNCHESVSVNDETCPHCGHSLVDDHEPDYEGMHDRFEDYHHGKVVTTKFHILGQGDVPGAPTQMPGDVDHSRVDQMSQSQEGAHQREVNFAVEQINDAITQGASIDESFLQNLQLEIVNKMGIDPQEAQTIVDAAMRQTQNQDQTLDALNPQPVDQAAADPSQAGAVGQGPEPVPVANGAFARTRRGTIGTVTSSWHDVWGERWVEVEDANGYRESLYADEVERATERTASAAETAATEIRQFLASTEPSSMSGPEVKARIANLRLACQEIRKLIANKKVSDAQAGELDDIQRAAEVELLNLTDTLPGFEPVAEPVEAIFDTADHIHPTLYGVEELSVLDDTPAIPEDAIAGAIPEEAEVFATDHADKPEAALLSMAASYIDQYTAGHPAETRALHRASFVDAVRLAASTKHTTDTKEASVEEDDLSLHDGPAEAIFLS